MFKNALASVAVHDVTAAAAWYEQLLGRAPDSSPMAELREWQFPHGGWLQVYQQAERAGSCSCTLAVSNLDEQIARLKSLGVAVKHLPPQSTVKVIMIADPDGNSIALVETLVTEIAQ